MQKLTIVFLWALLLVGLSSPGQVRAGETDISGTWAGTGVNNRGGKNTASLIVKENPDGTLTGKWGTAGSEMTIEKGERVTTNVLHWECASDNLSFHVRCVIEGESLVITYTCTWKEDGKVKGETGTSVLVRDK